MGRYASIMKLNPAEKTLFHAVGEVFDHPKETHKELTNKRASVMLSEKLEGKLEVVAKTGLLKWAFIPCFQQMFHDTNALPMGLHSSHQMVLDFLAYAHEANIRILGGDDELTAIAVIRGGEAVPYHGSRRARTLRFALREALHPERYNASELTGEEVVRALERYHYLLEAEGEDRSNSAKAAEAIDGILESFKGWISSIESYQDHHVIVDCFLRALQDEGLEIVEAK